MVITLGWSSDHLLILRSITVDDREEMHDATHFVPPNFPSLVSRVPSIKTHSPGQERLSAARDTVCDVTSGQTDAGVAYGSHFTLLCEDPLCVPATRRLGRLLPRREAP
ncbi:hypothetical protein CERSUDRAFT_97653 [Gelatoporia subvermispora B]|uniref:Uncharacterized protein n=1 Tax=Ceriporiopsis subvermispora (strain B) TaxID=914234 RepID=M2QBM8_CERS8|nr:hypothetical protein CERSUDRAFT_97653 [Gelatoporia subvermispora B]